MKITANFHFTFLELKMMIHVYLTRKFTKNKTLAKYIDEFHGKGAYPAKIILVNLY